MIFINIVELRVHREYAPNHCLTVVQLIKTSIHSNLFHHWSSSSFYLSCSCACVWSETHPINHSITLISIPKKGIIIFKKKKNNGGYVLFVHLITFLFLKNNTTKKVTYKILTVTPHQTSFFALLFSFTYTCIRIPFQTPNSFTSSRFNKQYSVQPPTTHGAMR